MLVNGVGREGKQIEVNNDFKITIPYGTFYVLYDKYESNNVALIARPEDIPYNYKDGMFNIPDKTKCNGMLTITPNMESNDNLDGKISDIYNIDEMLKGLSKNSNNMSFNLNINGNSRSFGNGEFRRMYKVCVDNEYIKVGYYTMGIIGETVYVPIIFTSRFVYTGQFKFKFNSDDYISNEKYVDSLLKSIEPLKKMEQKEEKLKILSYENSIKVKSGTIELNIPEELKYVVKDNDKDNLLEDEFELLAVSKTFNHSPKGYSDAPIGINIRKAVKEPSLNELWTQNENIIKEQITNILKDNIQNPDFKKTITYLKTEGNLAIAYAKAGECTDSGPYWRSYTFFIAHNDLWYTGMIYFNSQKNIDSSYIKIIEEFLNNIHPCSNIIINKYNSKLTKDSLGDFVGKNNKIEAIKVSNLFSKDVVFNNDNEITYDGKNHKLLGLQANSEVIDNYPIIKNNTKVFCKEIIEVMEYVEKNDKLRIEPEKYHKNFNAVTKNNPITGITYFMFCAWHMITILEKSKNNYQVVLDENIIRGLPNGYAKIIEFIKCLREYNEIYDDFKGQIIAVNNLDGPTGMISNRVKDADEFKQIYEFDTNKKNKSLKKDDEIKIDKDTLEYIKELSQEILNDIKVLATNLDKAKQEIISKKDILKICSSMMDVENNNMNLFTSYTSINDSVIFKVSYILKDLKEKTEFSYNIIEYVISFDFNGNDKEANTSDFPLEIIDKLNNLTKEEITNSIVEIIKQIKKNNSEIISTNSKEYVLEEIGKTFELVGTEFEGRNERIEKVNVGDKVKLIREPLNQYDKNAIDVRNEEGSLGHIPAYISKKLARLIDNNQLAKTAVIESVTPLSKRSKNCKKALISITLTDEHNKQMQLFDTSSFEEKNNSNKTIKIDLIKETKISKEEQEKNEMNQKLENWKQEVERIKKLRNEKIEEYKKEKQKELENKINKLEEQKQECSKYNKVIKDLEDKIKLQESELQSLGIFSLKRKNELREKIIIDKNEIEKIKNTFSQKIIKINEEIERSKTTNEKDICNYILDINVRYKNPTNPVKEYKIKEIKNKTRDYSDNITSIERENCKIMCEIIEFLSTIDKPLTVTEIQNTNYTLGRVSNQKLSALLSRLKKDGIINSVLDKKKIYFYFDNE